MSGQLIAPFSCDITPERALPLAGFRRRNGLSGRVAVPLEANGILTDTAEGPVAVIAIDTLFAGDALTRAVAGSWVGPMPQILWLASHTHGAPALDPTKPRLGQVDARYLAEVGARIAAAMAAAVPVPVTARRSGSATVEGAIWRRRKAWRLHRRPPVLSRSIDLLPDPTVPIPRDLTLHLLQDGDTPRAVLWSWPCHPLTTGDLDAVSADFPGLLREHLRQSLGPIPVIYMPGFCGDLRPAITTRGLSARSAIRFPAHLGTLPIFRRPDAAAQRALIGTLATAMERLIRSPSSPVTRPASLRRHVIAAPDLAVTGDGPGEVPLALCTMADVTILGVGAEVSALHHAPLAGMLPDRSLLTGCAGQTLGYMPADRQLPEGGYEVDGFREGFSLSGSWQPGIDARLAQGVAALCR